MVLLGQELRRLRKKARLSQREVEDALEQHRGWMSRIENAHYSIDYAILMDFVTLTGGDDAELARRVRRAAIKHYKSLGQDPPFTSGTR